MTLRIVSGPGEAPGFHRGTGKEGPCAPGARNGKVSRAAARTALGAVFAPGGGLVLVIAIVLLRSSKHAG